MDIWEYLSLHPIWAMIYLYLVMGGLTEAIRLLVTLKK